MAKPLPGLAGRLQELGSDYQTLTETARLEGLSTALPAVGTILIGVIILALILATCLLPHGPERGTRHPGSVTTAHFGTCQDTVLNLQ